MTNDKVTYKIKFVNKVSQGAISTLRETAESDVLNVEVETDGNIAAVTVWGDGNAIPVYEEQVMEKLSQLYPSAEIVDTTVEIGGGSENSP